MKAPKYILIAVVLAACGLWFFLHKSRVATPQQQTLATNAPDVTATATQSSAFKSTVQAVTAGDSNYANAVAEIKEQYNQGQISKDQAILETIKAENLKSQDFYGKAIDQNGEPIVNAIVNGNLILNDGTYGGFNEEKYSTVTDGSGLFEFTGLHGTKLNVLIAKDGYKMGDRGEGYKGPVGGKSSPANRAILTMWKIRGTDPLVKSTINATLFPDGNAVTLDMTTGKQTSAGDLRVTFSRFPTVIARGLVHPYDWQFKIEMLNGGLLQENDSYPYSAPDMGYQPSFEINVSSNNVPWKNQFEQDFYIRNSQGHYGLMKVLVYSASTPPEAQISFTINPSGSQSLEPDFSK
jgi:hypothetical protein